MPQLRVLIAEDEPVSAELLADLVAQEGHVVCGSVGRGAEVVAAAAALKPDVVLMDVHLADGVSGILATKDLLERVPVPVVVISGTESREAMEAIAKSGALGFIKKPVSAEELRVNLRLARHQNEVMEKLRAGELLHRSIFDNAAVGIYVCHPDGFYLSVNHAFAEMLGYAGPAELLRLVKSIDEQVYGAPQPRAALLQKLERGEAVRFFESPVYGRDGDRLWVAEHVTPGFDAEGRLAHYEGVVVNITDRKRAEDARSLTHNLLRNTLDAIAHGVAVVDVAGNVILSNRAFDSVLPLLCPGDPPILTGAAADLLERFIAQFREVGAQAELRGAMRIPGSDHEVRAAITSYLDAESDLLGAVLVLELTERPEFCLLLPGGR